MIHIDRKEDCCGCHACFTACPSDCIDMAADNEGFFYPIVDQQLCTDCGVCENVCPMTIKSCQGEPPMAFAAWNRDGTVRGDSSSGGVFNAIMQHVLNQSGVIIGAAFDNTMTLRHQSAQTEVDCLKFRGSKYLQSAIGEAYHEAKVHLKQGRRVLFSGTPCQIAGLYTFLGKDDDNLLTCDLVCHGVPSPKVFARYQAVLERQHGRKIRKINFRRKDFGWKKFSVAISFDNDTEYCRVFASDPFMFGFLQNTYLRPSCHACGFSRLPRVADITLGDFWGVGGHHPQWDDDRGTSLILVQTKKGKKAFDSCRDALVVYDADLSVAVRSNPCICGSVPPGKNRAVFFDELDRLPFEEMMKKYMSPPSFWRRLMRDMQTGVHLITHKLSRVLSL